MSKINYLDSNEKVPKLRFPKFTKMWKQVNIGDFLNEYEERVSAPTNLPIYSSSRTGLKPQKEYYNNREIINEGEYGVVPRGFFTYRHMSDDTTFKFNINDFEEKIAVSKEYPVFSTTNLKEKFLLYKLNESEDFKKFAIKQKKGGTRTRLYYKTLKKWKTYLPDIEEQNDISNFLTVVDDYISNQRKQLIELEKYKIEVSSNIFRQQTKFHIDSNQWKVVKLGDIFNEVTELNGKNNHLLLSVTIDNGIIPQESHNKRNGSSANKSKYKVVKVGDIAYNTMRMWQGAFGVSRYEGIVSPAYTVVRLKQGSIDFFAHLFKYSRTIFDFYRYSQGLTSDTWNLKYDHFSEIQVEIPTDTNVQQVIGDYLNNIEELVNLNKHRINELSNWRNSIIKEVLI